MPQVPFNSDIDLYNNEIQNVKFQMLASAPTPTEAKFYYDTTLHKFGYYNGTEWIYGTVYIEGTGIKINGNTISIDPDVVAQLTDLANYVPTSRTVNGYALSSNISLDYNDVGAVPNTRTVNGKSLANNISLTYTDVNAVPTTRTVNNKALSSDITLTAGDVNALPDSTTINDLTTTAQQNALNSGATSTLIDKITTNETAINTINSKIPSQASASNQLADKAFVNSTVQTNTASFDGSWATYAAIPTTVAGFTSAGYPEPTNNNYLVVVEDETQDGGTWRYKYVDDGSAYNKNKWKVEYKINETPMTADQLEALNSGITSTLVSQITTNQNNITTINGQISTINTTLATKISKFTATNPTLTTSGGVCTWSIVNSFATNEVQVQIFRTSDGVQVMTEVDTSASTIVVKFNSSSNITAGIYRAVVQG